jgi:hypothetical protein
VGGQRLGGCPPAGWGRRAGGQASPRARAVPDTGPGAAGARVAGEEAIRLRVPDRPVDRPPGGRTDPDPARGRVQPELPAGVARQAGVHAHRPNGRHLVPVPAVRPDHRRVSRSWWPSTDSGSTWSPTPTPTGAGPTRRPRARSGCSRRPASERPESVGQTAVSLDSDHYPLDAIVDGVGETAVWDGSDRR